MNKTVEALREIATISPHQEKKIVCALQKYDAIEIDDMQMALFERNKVITKILTILFPKIKLVTYEKCSDEVSDLFDRVEEIVLRNRD
jgi:hypothetical protein